MKTEFTFLQPAALLLLWLSTLNPQLSTVHAQGTAFTYQGRLTDGPNPANGTYDLRFAIYDSAGGGTLVAGPATNSAAGISNGLFTATLDFGSGVFSGADRWLEIGVRTNGGGAFSLLIPRQKLAVTPYAITAGYVTAPLPASQLSGTLPSGLLAGTYGGAVTFNNPANSFSGNGGGLTNVNATTLGGFGANQFWKTGGNSNTVAGADFLGTADNQPLEISVNGVRALRIEPNTNGAPNLIGGAPVNYVDPGIVGATIAGGGTVSGDFYLGAGSNRVSAIFGTIGGGRMNTVGADHAFIGGGIDNTIQAAAYDSVIGGGVANLIQTNANDSVLIGGTGNAIGQNSTYAYLGGGGGNSISGPSSFSVIGGGRANKIAGSQNGISSSTISGGESNTIQTNNSYSTVAGGYQNAIQTNGNYSVIGGGYNNVIKSPSGYATVAGGAFNIAIGSGATIGGGSANTSIAGTNYSYPTVAGGNGNTANGSSATVGGGSGNAAMLGQTTVAGGEGNLSSNSWATVGGGFNNRSTGIAATIAGGSGNASSGDRGAVGGGQGNISSGFAATVGGGSGNLAGGFYATVPGGAGSSAAGDYSFAAGTYASASHSGSFVWSDASDFLGFGSTAANQFNVRAVGGVRFVTAGAGATVDGQSVATYDQVTNLAAADITSGTFAAGRMPGLTGDVTSAPGSVATALANTTVAPGSYSAANITVDNKGRITAAANGTVGAPSGNYVFAVGGQQTIAAANAFQDITFNNDAVIDGWQHTAGETTYTNVQTGLYLIQYTGVATISVNSGITISMRAELNEAAITGSSAGAAITVAGEVSDISRSFLVSATAGDNLKLQLRASSTSALLSGASTVGPAVTMTIVRIQ